MKDYLTIANSSALWLSVVPLIALVFVQALTFSSKAIKSAPLVGLSREESGQAFRLGMTSAVGPAMSVFVVMLGLMAVIGGPLAWQRLTIIGGASTELAAANAAAEGMGSSLTSETYGIMEFANATWVMALNGSAWLLVTALLTHKMDGLTKKVAGSAPRRMAFFSTGAMCGAMGYMYSKELIKIANPHTRTNAVAGIFGFLGMLLLQRLTVNNHKLRGFNTGFAMIIGMIAAVIFNRMGV